MIYTYTLNPSIDHYIYVDRDIEQNGTNRAYKEVCVCGGKGINVSLACKALDIGTVCSGVCGGFTGDELLRQLKEKGINCDFIITDADTRINTKIVNNGSVTEINSKGTPPDKKALNNIISYMSRMTKDDTAVISGSMPYDADTVNMIFKSASNSGARLIVDTSSSALCEALKYKPYMIKPNINELHELFGVDGGVYENMKKVLSYGVSVVIVSCGGKGAYYADKEKSGFIPVKDAGYTVKNTTGAGDSMIAGYLYGEINGIDPYICAVSAGSAKAYCKQELDLNVFRSIVKAYSER